MSTNISLPESMSWIQDPKKVFLLGYTRHTKGYRILLPQSPVHIVETMHVIFAEDFVNSPNLLLSLPDSDGESYFACYPDTDQTVMPLIPQEQSMALPEPAQGTQEEALAVVEPAGMNVDYQLFTETITSSYLNTNTKNS